MTEREEGNSEQSGDRECITAWKQRVDIREWRLRTLFIPLGYHVKNTRKAMSAELDLAEE